VLAIPRRPAAAVLASRLAARWREPASPSLPSAAISCRSWIGLSGFKEVRTGAGHRRPAWLEVARVRSTGRGLAPCSCPAKGPQPTARAAAPWEGGARRRSVGALHRAMAELLSLLPASTAVGAFRTVLDEWIAGPRRCTPQSSLIDRASIWVRNYEDW